MRKIAKSKIMKFLNDFSALASKLGGVEMSEERLDSDESGGRFLFETKGGVLTAFANSGIDYTIFARFKDGSKAAAAMGRKSVERRESSWGVLASMDSCTGRLSEHSGKWNFHGDDALEVLVEFTRELTPILLAGFDKERSALERQAEVFGGTNGGYGIRGEIENLTKSAK